MTPAVNQIEVHPYFRQPDVLAANAERGILTQAWSPIGGITFYRDGSHGSTLEDPTIVEIATAHDRTPAQVMLRWHLQQGRQVIPKSVTPSRIAENFDVFDFELTADQLAAIDALDTGVRGGPDPRRSPSRPSAATSPKPDRTERNTCRSTRVRPRPRTRPSGSPATSGWTPSPTRASEGQRMVVAKVRFAPGARTAWHSHARGQTLHITERRRLGPVPRRAEARVAHPGQTLYCPPGEEHWHGAAPDSFMEHLAMLDQRRRPGRQHHLARARHRPGVPRRAAIMQLYHGTALDGARRAPTQI